MVFARKKVSRQIDSITDWEVLMATTRTLIGPQGNLARSAIMNEQFVEQAMEFLRTLTPNENELLNQACRAGYASAMAIAKHRTSNFSVEFEAAKSLLAGCLNCTPHEVDIDNNAEGFAIALTAIKAGARMLQLKRPEQAMGAIANGTMLALFSSVGENKDTKIYVASWGGNGNKCTFYVKPDLSITWTPETNEPPIFAQDNPIAALSELERALGKEVSFQDRLNANNEFVESLIKSGGTTVETTGEPFFKWNPPLPNKKPDGTN